MTPLRSTRRVGPSVLAAALALATAALAPATAGAVGEPQAREGQGRFDARSAAATRPVASVPAQRLARALGPQAVVEIDPVTGTPRQVARTDGALTGPSHAAPAEIALGYVRAHRDLFKLSDDALAALDAPADYVSVDGTHHLRWRQRVGGIPVLGAELRAHVAADGRLLAVQGSPLADTSSAAAPPRLSATAALTRARRDAGATDAPPAVTRGAAGATRATRFADGSSGQLVVFAGAGGPRLAWSVTVPLDGTHHYRYVLDAASGAVLKRENNVFYLSGRGTAWEYRPDGNVDPATYGQELRDYPDGWLTSDGSALSGNNVHVYSDVNDDNAAEAGEEVPKSHDAGGLPVWDYPFQPVATGFNCTPRWPCSWEGLVPGATWQLNREQNAAQVFWFLNRFHDHLAAPPIGFTPAAGNFEGADRVVAQSDDGANGSLKLGDDPPIANHPDGDHLNNANMLTPPDGSSPTMQMYLFTADDGSDPTVDANGGDDASVVYHEYGHGLSSRLVTDSLGGQALNSAQSGAMGEAWSDWYALDLLTEDGLQADDPGISGEVQLAAYLTGGVNSLRYQSLDCPVGRGAANCTRSDRVTTGGYTYADYGTVWPRGPEVHADGEIWAQTLWQLRARLGVAVSRGLITRAMELAPPEPSFLDMRNAILLADQASPARGGHEDTIWEVFAEREMGYFAFSRDGDDTAPVADDSMPPAGGADSTVSGTVTDADTGEPVPGATVRFPGGWQLLATTDANGRYSLSLPQHAYPFMLLSRDGYDSVTQENVTISGGANTRDFALRRNWALSSGSAAITRFSAPDFTSYGCGPGGAIDGSLATGWGSNQPAISDPLNGVEAGPRVLELKLPRAVDVTEFAIDPNATCGDDASAALGGFRLETSADGSAFRTTASGTFGPSSNGRRNPLAAAAGTGAAVTHIRLTMLSPQGATNDLNIDAHQFMDVSELSVYGTPTKPVGPPAPPPPLPPNPGPPRVPAPPPVPPVDRSAPKIAGLKLLDGRHGLRALRGRAGLKLQLRCENEPCRAGAIVTLDAKTARGLRLTRKRRGEVQIARVSARGFSATGRPVTLKLTVSRTVARRLGRARVLRVKIAVTATDASRNTATRTLRPALRR